VVSWEKNQLEVEVRKKKDNLLWTEAYWTGPALPAHRQKSRLFSYSKGLFGTAYVGFGFIYFAQIEAL